MAGIPGSSRWEASVDHGHERLYGRLTTEECKLVRDLEERAWGSLDVSVSEELLARVDDLTPQGWERVKAVILARVEVARERQRAIEERVERLEP